jgi:hypothetical protein
MSEQITITLPDRIAKRINEWAAFSQQDVTEMVATAIDVGLPELSGAQMTPVTDLEDSALLQLTKVKLDETAGTRLDNLLVKQREGELNDAERKELLSLMQHYHELWVRQAQALSEAVRRGIQPPLTNGNN